MAAMVPPSHWTPEDDLLLKNSVEAGASLESLAKGAVQFSRRFTIQEIQERWYSLLYNPIVSEEASHLMTEIELSSFHQSNSRPSKAESSKETRSASVKRKTESIRKSYYAMRKRICDNSFDMLDIDLLCGPGNSNLGDCDLPSADCFISDPVPNILEIQGTEIQIGGKHLSENLQYLDAYQSEGPGFGPSNELPFCNPYAVERLQSDENASDLAGPSFDGFACSSSLPQVSTSGTSTQYLNTANTFMIPESDDANKEGALRYSGPPSSTDLNPSMACDNASGLPPCAENYLAELFDSALDDELFFGDSNEMANSYFNEWSLLLLDPPTYHNDLPTEDMHIIGASGAHLAGPSDVALHHCYEKKVPEAQLTPPVPSFRYLGPEYHNGVICCTLNNEDPDIPSNDDVFLLTGPSNLAPSSNARKSNGGPAMKKNKQKDACAPSRVIGSSQPSGSGLKQATGDKGVRFELPKSNLQNAALRNSTNGELLNRIGSSINATAKVIIREAMKMERAASGIDKHAPSASPNFTTQREVLPKPSDKPDLSDQEEQWSENEFDAPYFSDVEAMILDMDLSPDEHDLHANPEVQRYQHEETKRTVIRLEQGANSCTQRAIAAQGALALLYGRRSKHFIKKSEVLLGRATEDFEVDIDLGREKNGAKISRRQAIIEMDMHGKFHLTNVGISSMYVNEREVATGQKLPLISGCLIQVRGLSFLFEMNHARVQQHVGSIMGGGPFQDHRPSIHG